MDPEDEEAEGEQAAACREWALGRVYHFAEDGTLDPELLAACMRNDTEAAKRLIEQGANPCCEDQRQWSPLIWAASHGNEDLTRLLIKHNAAEVYKYDENTKAFLSASQFFCIFRSGRSIVPFIGLPSKAI